MQLSHAHLEDFLPFTFIRNPTRLFVVLLQELFSLPALVISPNYDSM